MNVNIRKGIEPDFSSIYSLLKEFAEFQKTPERVMITLEQMIQEKDLFRCFVAETEDNRIVGVASFFFAYYSWSGKAIYLDDLYVQPKWRKLSIGKQLLNAVIDHAKEERCKKLRWQVSKWNTNAIDFYKSMGAEIDDVEINCDLYLTRF
jgi:GNAT superfamily N-acetyltransferase